ncbi:MAG: NYN domain-containing protein [Fibrobacter sp.]|nr:NYN domain-containing protein [Fibrobacter sp.]
MKKDPLRLFFFVDGYTLKKVNEFYRFHHPFHCRLDFRALKNWARQEALRTFAPEASYALMDCHYYHPYKDPRMYGGSWGLSCFERELRFAGFQIHYCDQVGPEGVRPNMSLLEDALTFASYHKMDAVVLLSTQGQYAPLPDRLRSMGLPTLLLGWQFSYTKDNRLVRWRTDPGLQELATRYVAMDRVAERSICYDSGGLFCTE